MAVKEEKYDPGYEAAYGGAYSENPCGSEPCSFSSDGLSMSPPSVCFFQRLGFARIGERSIFRENKFLKNGNGNTKIYLVT